MDSEPAPQPPVDALPPRRKDKVSTGSAVAIVLAVYGGIAVLGILAYWNHPNHTILPTKSNMRNLEVAIKSYRTEYLRLPSPDATARIDDNPPFDTTDSDGIALINLLLAKDKTRNPREIVFWDPPPRKPDGSGFDPKNGLVDLMSMRGYRIVLDYSGDGKITNPNDHEKIIDTDVIVYSAGADGNFDTWKDNMCSWK